MNQLIYDIDRSHRLANRQVTIGEKKGTLKLKSPMTFSESSFFYSDTTYLLVGII